MKIICKQCHTRFEEKEKYCPYCYEKAVRSIPIGTTDRITKARTYSRSDLKQFDKTKVPKKMIAKKKNNVLAYLILGICLIFGVTFLILNFAIR